MVTKEFKRLLKSLKAPGGMSLVVREGTFCAEWEDHGGHYGTKVVEKVRRAAQELGYVPECSSRATQTGTVVFDTVFVEGDVKVSLLARYGETAHYNYFNVLVTASVGTT